MSLVRKVFADCDAVDILGNGHTKDCFASQPLDPASTQPYQDLIDKGWRVFKPKGEGIKTVCPKHGERVEVR